MQRKNTFIVLIFIGMAMVMTAGLWLATAQPVSAQCGSQASTCKDCHEVQGQMSVNADGTGWHQSHAFGDFCYICHAGNQQATDKDTAHTGMVPPLSDAKASCQQCHPKDLADRAKVYADILGVEVGGIEGSAPSAGPATDPAAGAAAQNPVMICEPQNNVPEDKTLVLAQPAEPVDYVAQYNRNVLGIREVNWGMIGLMALIAVIVLGGAGFAAIKTGWLVVTFEKPVKEEPKAESTEEPKA
ncbi:MAG: hypothetical protein HY869_06440 [Chloroflexi bacterium]|nr:hypothetical protein [Chloroflexota bacterium]